MRQRVLEQARHQLAGRSTRRRSSRTASIFYNEVIGRFDEPLLPPNAAHAQGLRRAEVDRLRSGARRVPRRVRLRHPAAAQGPQAGRAAAGGRLPARAGRPAAGRRSTRRTTRPTTTSPPSWPSAGFVTFAPQNPTSSRTASARLQRKANPLGKTLFSIIVPQHQQIVDWLGTLPFVDPRADRLLRPVLRRQDGHARAAAGDGLLPVDLLGRLQRVGLEERLDAAAATATCGTGEYEIFEFDLGSTFNYAEMAALIAPRPFMVERGPLRRRGARRDRGLRVRQGAAPLRGQAGHRRPLTEIECFVGPHTINGVGTFEFLHKHLRWPEPEIVPPMRKLAATRPRVPRQAD